MSNEESCMVANEVTVLAGVGEKCSPDGHDYPKWKFWTSWGVYVRICKICGDMQCSSIKPLE